MILPFWILLVNMQTITIMCFSRNWCTRLEYFPSFVNSRYNTVIAGLKCDCRAKRQRRGSGISSDKVSQMNALSPLLGITPGVFICSCIHTYRVSLSKTPVRPRAPRLPMNWALSLSTSSFPHDHHPQLLFSPHSQPNIYMYRPSSLSFVVAACPVFIVLRLGF